MQFGQKSLGQATQTCHSYSQLWAWKGSTSAELAAEPDGVSKQIDWQAEQASHLAHSLEGQKC